MRKALSITLVLAVALAGSAFAKPVEYNVRSLDNTSSDIVGKSQGVFSSAAGGTTFFGGTYWNGATSRWEAIADSVWTFDSGVGSDYNLGDPEVNPFKNPAFHTHMEGWVGRDDTYGGDNPYMRLLENTDALWDSSGVNICVGTNVGLSGNWSWWAGRTAAEVLTSTTDCFFGGQGYGGAWNLYIERSFGTVVPTGASNLSFDAYVETEDDFDFARAFVDTGDGTFQEVWSADGALGVVSASVNLPQGSWWPQTTQDVVVRLGFESDGAWDDGDGQNNTACGAVAYDEVSLTGGGVTYGPQGFEAGADGWAKVLAEAGLGDWSDLRDSNTQIPAYNTACVCDLQDTVLVAYDPNGATTDVWHVLDTEVMVNSPWVDIDAAGLTGSPVKFFQYSTYADTPLENFIFRFHQMKWTPQFCPGTGLNIESGWNSDGFVYYGDPFCDSVGQIPTRLDYSEVADPGAEQLRIAIGVLNLCTGWGWCVGLTNFSPVFDNVSVGIGGNPLAPFVTTTIVDTPYDSFPENNTLRADAPGRVDCNQANDENQPFSSVGDTLIAVGGGGKWGSYGGTAMEVLFAVSPGPGITSDAGKLAAFNAWLTDAKHTSLGVIDGQSWYYTRMDTSEANGAAGNPSTWMTAYHELTGVATDDTLTDPNDLNPYGLETRLANDIFPDDMFTPGTHISFVYRTYYVENDLVTPANPGQYYYDPPTFDLITDATPGDFYEMEVLPSSMDLADSSWNCVLYVNHADDRGAGFEGSSQWVEDALDNVITSGKGGNFEGTFYDIFDVDAPSSNQGSFGRPTGSEYGAAAQQLAGYKNVVWYSRSLSSTSLKEPDADVLTAWLTSLAAGVGPNRIYLTGDGVADAMANSSAISVTTLLSSYLGIDLTCSSYRDQACNASGSQQTDNCIGLDPVGIGGGAHFDATTIAASVVGNGCPAERDYDVLAVSASPFGDAQPNEEYNDGSFVTQYSSVSHNVTTGTGYRSVLDGLRIDNRRDATCSNGVGAAEITDRMQEVADWLGFSGAGAYCNDPYFGLDVGPKNPTFVTALRAARPNPFTGKGLVTLEFSLELSGKAKLEVFNVNGRLVNTIFDGVAEAGPNVVNWDAKDQAGNSLASGVYFYRLSANGQELAKKQVVIRSGN